MRRALAIGWLTVLWVVLWRDPSPANLLSGLALAGLVSVLVPTDSRHRVRPLPLLRFVAFFLRELVAANFVLAREVVTPANRIHTGIIAVPLPGFSDLVVTIVANATSLTPGTLTLEVARDPEPVLYIHVLHLHDHETARSDVLDLAARVAAAFPQREAAQEVQG